MGGGKWGEPVKDKGKEVKLLHVAWKAEPGWAGMRRNDKKAEVGSTHDLVIRYVQKWNGSSRL